MYIRHWTTEAHVTAYLGMLERVAREKFGRVSWLEDGDSPSVRALETPVEHR